MKGTILVVNAGSSSIKFSAFDAYEPMTLELIFKGKIEGIGNRPRLEAHDAAGGRLIDKSYDPTIITGYDGAIAVLAEWLGTLGGRGQLLAVGHRVVHGGSETMPVLVNDDVLEKLEQVVPLMPLHQPANLAAIQAFQLRKPGLPQVACFDTTFHRSHSDIAQRFALPEPFHHDGVRRYGFHGLSYEYIAEQLPVVAPDLANGRVIVAHLGSGASMCALKAGRSVDATMAFSALDGLPMGTRCGAIDPGVLIYLIRDRHMSVDAVERLLYRESGLRGLSGLSSDVRDLLASNDPAARLALDYFVYHACRQLGSLAATLEGLDGIVFTAGIGENSPEIRQRICLHAAWLGLRLDFDANRAGGPRISAPGSTVSAWVIPTDEEIVIARHTQELIRPLWSSL